MRKTYKRPRLDRCVALDVVRSYHLRGEPQISIVRRLGLDSGHVSRIVRGAIHADVYAQVEAEERELKRSAAQKVKASGNA